MYILDQYDYFYTGLYAPSRSQTKFDEHATKTIIMAVASFLYAHRNALIFFTVLCYLVQVFLLLVFMTPDTCLVALGKSTIFDKGHKF